jgi:hypothetical protein
MRQDVLVLKDDHRAVSTARERVVGSLVKAQAVPSGDRVVRARSDIHRHEEAVSSTNDHPACRLRQHRCKERLAHAVTGTRVVVVSEPVAVCGRVTDTVHRGRRREPLIMEQSTVPDHGLRRGDSRLVRRPSKYRVVVRNVVIEVRQINVEIMILFIALNMLLHP